MKTTCLMPVPVEEWMQRTPKSGHYPVYDPNDLKPELGFKTARFDSYNNSWFDDQTAIHPEFVYEPQSGYFFTEEKMKEILSVASSEKELAELHKEIDLDLSIPTGEALGWRRCLRYVTQLLAPEK